MTAGTVVITGGILATVILLCIIAVLCYCRLQVPACGLQNERPHPGRTRNGGSRGHGGGGKDLANATGQPWKDGVRVPWVS